MHWFLPLAIACLILGGIEANRRDRTTIRAVGKPNRTLGDKVLAGIGIGFVALWLVVVVLTNR